MNEPAVATMQSVLAFIETKRESKQSAFYLYENFVDEKTLFDHFDTLLYMEREKYISGDFANVQDMKPQTCLLIHITRKGYALLYENDPILLETILLETANLSPSNPPSL
jgi:hypothetical protein